MGFGRVRAKTVSSVAPVIRWLASALLACESRDGRNTANAVTAVATPDATAIHTERLSFEYVRAGCAMAFIFASYVVSPAED